MIPMDINIDGYITQDNTSAKRRKTWNQPLNGVVGQNFLFMVRPNSSSGLLKDGNDDEYM